jgi:hypothetical protein
MDPLFHHTQTPANSPDLGRGLNTRRNSNTPHKIAGPRGYWQGGMFQLSNFNFCDKRPGFWIKVSSSYPTSLEKQKQRRGIQYDVEKRLSMFEPLESALPFHSGVTGRKFCSFTEYRTE